MHQKNQIDRFRVIVHNGPSIHQGHYSAFVRTLKGWYEFNDDKVLP